MITPSRVTAGPVIVGDCERSEARSPSRRPSELREPEVQHLHRAVRPQLDIGWLEIAVDDALLVRGFERLRDLPRDRQCFVHRDGPCAMRSARVGPSTSSITQRLLHPIVQGRKSPRCSDDSARRGLPLPLKSGQPSGSEATDPGSTLMATARFRLVSVARYTSPIPPTPIWAVTSYGPRRVPEARANRSVDYTGEAAAQSGLLLSIAAVASYFQRRR